MIIIKSCDTCYYSEFLTTDKCKPIEKECIDFSEWKPMTEQQKACNGCKHRDDYCNNCSCDKENLYESKD
jgi:hypothetical protein